MSMKQRLAKDPNNLAWATDATSYGARLLEKMGWKRGNGLGKTQQGQTDNVSAKVRADHVGIGAEGVKVKQDTAWTEQARAYEEALKKLSSIGKKKKDKKSSKGERSEKPKRPKREEVAKHARPSHRSKYIKSKSVGLYSEEALKQILGGL